MQQGRAEIIDQLRRDVLVQRFSTPRAKLLSNVRFEPFSSAFHANQFPLGAIHEFICSSDETFTASAGFVSGILSSLMQNNGVSIWISSTKKMFPPAFIQYGIRPDKIVFINHNKPGDILWIMEEALRCKGLAAVICDTRELSFKQSRRLQLATEQSQVTGFVLRNKPRMINTTACATRWLISPAFSRKFQNIPGIGFPCWDVELQKVKNGKPQSWKISWSAGHFNHVQEPAPAITIHQKKAG